jgi:hypothetical protein
MRSSRSSTALAEDAAADTALLLTLTLSRQAIASSTASAGDTFDLLQLLPCNAPGWGAAAAVLLLLLSFAGCAVALLLLSFTA